MYARGGRIAGGGGRIAAGGGLFAGGGGLFAGGPFAGGPFAAGLIAGGPFASGLNAAHRQTTLILQLYRNKPRVRIVFSGREKKWEIFITENCQVLVWYYKIDAHNNLHVCRWNDSICSNSVVYGLWIQCYTIYMSGLLTSSICLQLARSCDHATHPSGTRPQIQDWCTDWCRLNHRRTTENDSTLIIIIV